MIKYAAILLLASLFIGGCSFASAKLPTDEQKPSSEELSREQVKSEEQTAPKPFSGVVAWDSITHKSAGTNLYIKGLEDSYTEVQYQIWRTADGISSKKVFSSHEAEQDFVLPFDLQSFDSKRGEYQIHTVGMKEDGTSTNLARSVITFPQYVPILMYHGIDEYRGQGLRSLFVSPADFEAQMTYLKKNGYTMLTFERWSEVNRVNKPILVTLDDGLKDNLNALHILQKLQDDTFQPAATEYMIAGALGMPGFLTKEDLKQMSDSGIISVQAHTMTHSNLTTVTDYEHELKRAKDIIEEVTGKPVISLAYPVGFHNEKVIEETKKYYEYAVTIIQGQYIQQNRPNEAYIMERIAVPADMTMEQFINAVREKK